MLRASLFSGGAIPGRAGRQTVLHLIDFYTARSWRQMPCVGGLLRATAPPMRLLLAGTEWAYAAMGNAFALEKIEDSLGHNHPVRQ